MALADITQKITDEARERVARIHAHAEEEVSRIKEDGEKQKEELRKKHEAERARIIADNEKRVLSSADKEVKAKKDAAKRAVIDEVFATALNELEQSDVSTYRTILTPLIKDLPKEGGTYILPRTREKDTRSILTEADISPAEVELSDAFHAGLIYRDTEVEYDLSFPTLMEGKKAALETEIAGILFTYAT